MRQDQAAERCGGQHPQRHRRRPETVNQRANADPAGDHRDAEHAHDGSRAPRRKSSIDQERYQARDRATDGKIECCGGAPQYPEPPRPHRRARRHAGQGGRRVDVVAAPVPRQKGGAQRKHDKRRYGGQRDIAGAPPPEGDRPGSDLRHDDGAYSRSREPQSQRQTTRRLEPPGDQRIPGDTARPCPEQRHGGICEIELPERVADHRRSQNGKGQPRQSRQQRPAYAEPAHHRAGHGRTQDAKAGAEQDRRLDRAPAPSEFGPQRRDEQADRIGRQCRRRACKPDGCQRDEVATPPPFLTRSETGRCVGTHARRKARSAPDIIAPAAG